MPKNSMNLVHPFNNVGVDFTSHLYIKNERTNTLEKVYILIFTCLNIRAVHYELLPDMTTKQFLLAFKRFCNLYAIPNCLFR